MDVMDGVDELDWVDISPAGREYSLWSRFNVACLTS